jgi:hypothetical protein
MSDVARRRIAALLLIAGIAVGALAIADVGPFEDPPTEEQRVRDAAEEFFAAAAAGDRKGFCGGLTPDARQTLAVRTAQQFRLDEPPSCPEVLALLKLVFNDSALDVNSVSVSGPRARVEARLKLKGAGADPRTILLDEVNGEWLVADPG